MSGSPIPFCCRGQSLHYLQQLPHSSLTLPPQALRTKTYDLVILGSGEQHWLGSYNQGLFRRPRFPKDKKGAPHRRVLPYLRGLPPLCQDQRPLTVRQQIIGGGPSGGMLGPLPPSAPL